MKKIKIPANADMFISNITETNYHVAINSNDEFEAFCQENNIGYHEGARKDIVKSAGHVFTTNKDIFENFKEIA